VSAWALSFGSQKWCSQNFIFAVLSGCQCHCCQTTLNSEPVIRSNFYLTNLRSGYHRTMTSCGDVSLLHRLITGPFIQLRARLIRGSVVLGTCRMTIVLSVFFPWIQLFYILVRKPCWRSRRWTGSRSLTAESRLGRTRTRGPCVSGPAVHGGVRRGSRGISKSLEFSSWLISWGRSGVLIYILLASFLLLTLFV